MSEMVERLARVICATEGHDPDGDWRVSEQGMLTAAPAPGEERWWTRYRKHARLAIEAMREPTARMIAEGESAASFGIGRPTSDDAIPTVWEWMIAGALWEGKPA